MLLLDNGTRKKIEEIVGEIDFSEVKVLSEIYGVIAASPKGITINAVAQKYNPKHRFLSVQEITAIVAIFNNAGIVTLEQKNPITESFVRILQLKTVKTEADPEIKPGGFPVIINKAQMEKAKNLLLPPNSVTLAKLLEKLKLPQTPEGIKALLGRLKTRFKLAIMGDPENPESCILKIEP